MILHFALPFDGMRPAPPVTAVGEATVGPARLLDLLELHLGLPPVLARPGEALLAYQRCLAELDHTERFYHRSFAVDPLGVARTLLGWRAQWHEHGWRGRFADTVSKRLADMAAVEAVARSRVPLTHGERIARVLADLDAGRTPGIDRIMLHQEPGELPFAWRALLERFDVEVAPGVAPAPRARADTDLGRVQRALRERLTGDEGAAHPPKQLTGDRSFIVVRAVSRDLSAQVIAEYLRGQPGVARDTVVIAERDGIIVDNAFERVGLPRAGFQHYTRFRAVTQALKLCLSLVWEPVDAHLLLQLLIHPVGPLPAWVRSELAGAVARAPGIGGTPWREAVDAIAARQREVHGKTEHDVDALRADIAFWLENERHDSRAGAPLRVLIERAQRCATWLARELHTNDDPENDTGVLYATALGQAEALIAALGELHARGEERIRRIALEQLVDEVGGHSPDPTAFAQAGHVRATTDPASVTQAWRRVVWWDLAPLPTALGYPWSEAELDELAREGVALPAASERIRARLRRWLRALLNAEEQLVLVIHDRDEGHHPLWTQIQSAFRGFTEVRIEDELLASGGRASISALDVPTEPLPLRALPRPRRWWRLPAGCAIPPPETSSYSSLAKLLFHPHEWVLGYAARLRRGRAADLTGGNLLYGNLVHRLLQQFFDELPDWAALGDREIERWLTAHLPALIRAEGALLCEPGERVVRERVQSRLERAFTRLLFHLRSAEIVSVAAEQHATAPFADTTLSGYIDLLLGDSGGRQIVLDVKWGGQGRRANELAINRHLQLATYAHLCRAASGAPWPHHAYYIASTGYILAPDTSIFPHALAYPPTDGETTAHLWDRVAAHYAWRRTQLAAGVIEVTAAGTEPDEESVPPENALELSGGPSYYDEFTLLTGWEDGI